MNDETARGGVAGRRRLRRILLSNVWLLCLGAATAGGLLPATAKTASRYRLEHKLPERASRLPFGDIPKGPLEIFVSIDQQKLHFYSDGVHVADEPVATGVPGHLTPLGVFNVIQRDRYHRSNIYDDAPMPYMQRITWSGVALHEGVGLGHEASHGCIRMPGDFAARLWMLHTIGMRVIIARPELRPLPFADAHLFVHKVEATAPAIVLKAAKPAVETAQKADPASSTDLADPPVGGTIASKAPEIAAAEQIKNSNATPSAPSTSTTPTAGVAGADGADDAPPLPPARPALGHGSGPIAIFVSRKTGKIYVRQEFDPLFNAPVTVEHPDQPIGTHVFTAMDYLPDHSGFRWTEVTLPEAPPTEVERWKYQKDAYGRVRRVRIEEPVAEPPPSPPPETASEALARIQIPQDVIDQISALIVPGSSLVISDQGLGPETGDGTDFIVITH